MSNYKKLLLKGKAVVFIDWANVHGWEKNLKKLVNPERIFSYLSEYAEIKNIRLYFDTDRHEKSEQFLKNAAKTGYEIITKPVKYILVKDGNREIPIRKCDFDMEACIDVHRMLNEGFESFIFFAGDGDYAPLYQMLIKLKKQAIVVYTQGHLGREIWEMKRGIFKVELNNLIEF